LNEGINTILASNRYGKPYESREFKNGFITIPASIYIHNDFSISAWVNLTVNKAYNVLVSFANEEGSDLIWIGFKHLNFYVEISDSLNRVVQMMSNNSLPKGCWTHVTFVLKNSIGYMYLNGSLNNNAPLVEPNRVVREFNFIGKDSYDSSLYFAEGAFEHLKVYRGALTDKEIKTDFNMDGYS